MKKSRFASFAAIIALSAMLAGCGGTIDTGNVGVRTQFGKIQQEVEQPGAYLAVLSHVDEYTVKETSVPLAKLTPKAKDKLILKELDVTVYYKVHANKVAEFASTHGAMSAQLGGEHSWRPGYYLIENVAKGVISDETSKFDSLTLHQNRQALEAAIKVSLAEQLTKTDPGYFDITRVVISTLLTDPSIEDSIRKSIMVQNDLAAATQQVQVKQQLALANEKLTQSLTPMFLQHEYIEALKTCAGSQHCTMIIDGSKGGALVNVASSLK